MIDVAIVVDVFEIDGEAIFVQDAVATTWYKCGGY